MMFYKKKKKKINMIWRVEKLMPMEMLQLSILFIFFCNYGKNCMSFLGYNLINLYY